MMAMVLVMAFTGCNEKGITATVSVSVAGEAECVNEVVPAVDLNDNGVTDIDDVLRALAENKGETYESADGGYGLAITDLWGDDSGAFGYYVNNEMADNLEEEIEDGAVIDVYSYKDTEGFSDVYTYFAERNVEAKDGEAVLTLMMVAFDKDFNPVAKPCAGAIVAEEDMVYGKTDKDGKITVKVSEGEHQLMATGDGIVPAGVTVAGN